MRSEKLVDGSKGRLIFNRITYNYVKHLYLFE